MQGDARKPTYGRPLDTEGERGQHGASRWKLLDANGTVFWSSVPGTIGGHRRTRIYGRLDCPAALRAIERGQYATHRVFFLDERTAMAAGYRPCGVCLRDRYREWKAARSRLLIGVLVVTALMFGTEPSEVRAEDSQESAGTTKVEPLSETPRAAGRYLFTTETVLPHLEEALRYATTTETQCLDGTERNRLFPLLQHPAFAGCVLEPSARHAQVTQHDREWRFELRCANPGAASGSALMREDAGTLRATLDLKMGGKNMTLSQRRRGVRQGEC